MRREQAGAVTVMVAVSPPRDRDALAARGKSPAGIRPTMHPGWLLQPLSTGARKIVLRNGSFGRYVASGHLLYVRAGTLFAVPFDLDRLEVMGEPVPTLEGMRSDATTGDASPRHVRERAARRNGELPTWSHTKRELFYGTNGQIRVAPYTSKATRSMSRSRGSGPTGAT